MNKTIAIGAVAVLVVAGGMYWAFSQPKENAGAPAVNPMTVTSGENPQPGSQVHDLPVEPAAAAARRDLAAKQGIEEKSIVIMRVEDATWNDGCLGLGGPAESCMQALVEGFRVEMLAQGETYSYRTDKTGASIRAETN